MATVEWGDIPFDFITPLGLWTLNAASGYRYLLDQQNCQMGAGLRYTSDDMPQESGEIIHRTFREGYSVHLAMQLWQDENPACRSGLRHMWDDLMAYTTSLIDVSQAYLDGGLARMRWTPSGAPQRLLDRIRLLEPPVASIDEVGLVTVTFSVQSPYPYAITATQTQTDIAPGFGATLTNGGSSPMYPVFQIYGPATSFTFTNTSSGLDLIFDSALPGASSIADGHYIEIDTFRNTCYYDGSGANYKPGINIPLSDFWPLLIGSNILSFTAAGTGANTKARVLWNNAWA